MHSVRSPLSIALSMIVVVALMPVPYVSLLRSVIGQKTAERAPLPRPGKPEGTLPDLEEVRGESRLERQPPAPIHSTDRSSKVPQQPWNGRRVGDPLPDGKLDHGMERRAHARRRVSPPPPVLDDQFVQNFLTAAVLRSPTTSEATFWIEQLRVAYMQGQASVKLAAVALGKTLFESAEYAARNRDNHWYVYDLYKTFLMRDPDASGWAYWESVVPANGRENVRRAFEEAPEFAGILASIVPNGLALGSAASLISARVEPRNQPGHGMLARDATWSVPLLSLPGRNGLDLGLALSYSSQVWTRSGPYIHFDEDNGFPSPGFRLGFPVIQRKVFDAQTAKNSFLLINATGQRVQLRQVGSSNIYEAADSSYLQLTDYSPNLVLRSTDGTQLSFIEIQNEFRCWQIKDRNGNYLTIASNPLGQMTNITDTLGRVINFNYDTNANLISITQSWNGQPAHQWVSFGWGTRTMQSSFSDGAVVGTVNGLIVPVITQVSLNDTSYFTFDYNNSLQVTAIRNYFGAVERNATTFTYETPSNDVLRLLDSRVSAQNWTGVNGVPSQVITQYSVAADGACVLTAPDGTIYKEYYGIGWQKGLTTQSEIWSGGVKQKWTTTAWTQDNTSVGYEMNPRVVETNVYDAGGNRRRTVIDYGQYAQYGLPYYVAEYAADGATVLRLTFTDYNLSQAYLDRRIIGLVSALHVKNGSDFETKITYDYDDPARLQSLPAAATQHDSTAVAARGNVTAVSRWDVNDINNATKRLTTYTNYLTTDTPTSSTDPAGHQSSVSYTDSFSDSVNRNTFAYPTTMTDADGNSAFAQYNFDFGATTRTQSPAPAGQAQGAIQTMSYNSLGQLELITTVNNGAYKRFWYGANYAASYTTVNNVADELYSIAVTDGLGRVFGTFGNHPGSTGGYFMVITIYDQMGRALKVSNPTEIYGNWVPAGDDAAGIYYTQQTYDWNGRPLVTTNQDGTTKEVSYAGCGCAGGAVVTLTDEGTIDAGVAKRRQQKIYSDVLGRTVKTEMLNWEGGTVYSTTVNTYNARDQVEQIRQYEGPEGGTTHQDTIMTYDGYGRLKTRHLPEQQVDPNNSASSDHTTWQYNADDTIAVITDARGATATSTYNARHLPDVITHALSGSPTIVEFFAYDAAGNRTFMSDSAGSTSYQYDQLSRLTSETQQFNGLAGFYPLTYQYNLAGQLTSLTYPGFNTSYTYDATGRTKTVTGPPRWTGITQYVSDIQYRASGSYKTISYGSSTSLSVDYNARLKLQSFKIRAVYNNQWYEAAHVESQYYADGSLRTTQDFLDPRFSRSYSFDQVRSLYHAGSAVYTQTFQHDAFGNTTNRISGIWSQWDTFTATWINGRNQNPGWQYNANGDVRFDDSFEYTYDAKGQNTKLRTLSNNLWISQSINAEGQMTKRSTGDATSTFSTTYYLRSTVLGGKVVAEYDRADHQQKRYVYFDGQLLATDEGNDFSLEHRNPLTGSRGQSYWSGISGVYDATAEPDSSGVIDVGFSDPNDVPALPPAEPDIASILPGPSGQCRVEGIQSEFGCYLALRMLAGKTALRCPNDDCDARLITVTRTIGGELAAISRFYVTAGDPGWDGSLDGRYTWYSDVNVDLNDPKQAKAFLGEIPDQLHGEWLKRLGPQQPQAPITEKIHWWELAKIFTHLRAMAERGRCQEFLTKLLERAGDTGGDKPVHTNILDLFIDVVSQQGFVTQKEVSGRGFSTVRGAVGAPGGAQVRLSNGSNDFRGKLRIEYFAYDALSELTHVAGSKESGYGTGAFSDYHLAKVALNVANEMGTGIPNLHLRLPTVDPNNDQFSEWSDAYHHIVSLYCKRQERF